MLEELARTSPGPAAVLADVLASKVRLGRIERDEHGSYSLVVEAFAPAVLEALAELA